ncbi:MAG TPA: ATP-binding protein [Caulobacteraceae bacterium]|nr:ATP-binding protein [Caulobacteraceae bacterium]
MTAMFGVDQWTQRRPGKAPMFSASAWLVSVGYSAAAFYLTFNFGGPAQTLGVTLYGVMMFQILARDYAAPRRLMVDMSAPLASMLLIQLAGGFLLVRHHQAWELLTLLASPLIVFRAFHTVQQLLERSDRQAREAMAQLAESEMRYRLIAERSPDIIIRYDIEGRIEYISPAARNYNYEPDELVGRNVRELLEPQDQERNAAFMADLAAGRPVPQGAQNVWRTWNAAGEALDLEGVSSPVTDDDGHVIGAIAVLRDVTARRALEAELTRQREDAEAANEAKSQFLANMSHEVRTPLTGVVGFARLLEAMDDLPALARQYVTRIGKSAEALLAVVNDVLDFSKLEASQLELDPQPFAPRAFLEETLDLAQGLAADKGLTLRLVGAGDLPAFLTADRARLRQVLLNLLTNAVKFTEAGEIVVAAGHSAAVLRIAVRDTGPGLTEAQGGRLFQRFSQVDGSHARQHGGSGLGLAICKGLVEMMGGEIGLDSQVGLGSTFWFTVRAPVGEAPPTAASPPDAPQIAAPRVSARRKAAPSAAAPEQDVAAADSTAPDTTAPDVRKAAVPPRVEALDRLRLLVVDDVAVNRELVCALLSPFDVDITQAASGTEAVEAALGHPFDLILMDLQMPGMDGLAAATAIRAHADLNAVTPILALSANILPDHVAQCLAAGMNDHIGKPIEAAELLGKIAKWTAGRGDEPEAMRA